MDNNIEEVALIDENIVDDLPINEESDEAVILPYSELETIVRETVSHDILVALADTLNSVEATDIEKAEAVIKTTTDINTAVKDTIDGLTSYIEYDGVKYDRPASKATRTGIAKAGSQFDEHDKVQLTGNGKTSVIYTVIMNGTRKMLKDATGDTFNPSNIVCQQYGVEAGKMAGLSHSGWKKV